MLRQEAWGLERSGTGEEGLPGLLFQPAYVIRSIPAVLPKVKNISPGLRLRFTLQ